MLDRLMVDKLFELKYEAAAWLRAAQGVEWTKPDTPYGLGFALNHDTRASYRVWFAALSMSCELWLKYLYAVYACEMYPPVHKLTEIYDTLPEPAKTLLDARFIYETQKNLWEPLVMDAEWHRNRPYGQDTKTSLTTDTSRFRSYFQLLDGTRSDFAPCIDRYHFEQYADTSFTPYLSRSAEQIAAMLERTCRSTYSLEDDGPIAMSPTYFVNTP